MRAFVLVAILTAWLGAARSWAGSCDEEGAAAMVADLEKYAKKPKAKPFVDDICMDMAQTLPRLVKRTLAACQVILEREPAYAPCIEWPIKAGAKTLGTISLFERATEAFPQRPFSYGDQAMALYDALADVRALPLVTEAWKVAAADKRAGQAKHAFNWKVWRSAAARLLGKLGGPAQRDFLVEQLALPENKSVAKALRKAIAQIDAAKDK